MDLQIDDDLLLDLKALKIRFPLLPCSPNHLRRMEARGFPPAIKISERRRAWRLSAILAYLEKKENEANERAAKAASAHGRR